MELYTWGRYDYPESDEGKHENDHKDVDCEVDAAEAAMGSITHGD